METALKNIVIKTNDTDANGASSPLLDQLALQKVEMTRFREEQQRVLHDLKHFFEALQTSSAIPETKLSLVNEKQGWRRGGHAEIHLSSSPNRAKLTCHSTCCCSCHRSKSIDPHPVARHLLGSLFATYTAFPRPRSKCSVANCIQQASNIRVVYFFPYWLLHRALYFSYVQLSSGPKFSLTVRRVVPINSNINFYVAAGLIENVYGAFSARRSTPNDIHGVSGETPLHVCSISEVDGLSVNPSSLLSNTASWKCAKL
jgi:hypothetical protein